MDKLPLSLLALLIGLPLAHAAAADQMARTLDYEPAEVILVGHLTSQVFPGRPITRASRRATSRRNITS